MHRSDTGAGARPGDDAGPITAAGISIRKKVCRCRFPAFARPGDATMPNLAPCGKPDKALCGSGFRHRPEGNSSSMLILGIHSGYHDANVALHDGYRLLAAVAQERMTRRKIDGGRIPTEAIDEVLAIAGVGRRDVDAVVLGRGAFPLRYYTHLPLHRRMERAARRLAGAEKHKSMERECVRAGRHDSEAMFDAALFLADEGFRPDIPVRFFNHHLAHALPTLFHTDWSEALLHTSDGGGDNIQYSIRRFRDGRLDCEFGADSELTRPTRIDSLGLAYGYATQVLGYKINRHEGKLTGLAAHGEPALAEALAARFRVHPNGEITSDFASYPDMRRFVFDWAEGAPPEVVAASVQKVLEDKTVEAVGRLTEATGIRRLGLAGGVYGNVRLNELLSDRLGLDEVFIYPAMSDQGLAAGGILQFLLERDGMAHWLDRRWRFESLYYGRDCGAEADRVLAATPGLAPADLGGRAPAEAAARRIAAGDAVAIFSQGMEYGPRALGARSILAAPVKAQINQSLNDRLDRSEFMPFAPVVREEDAETVFDIGPAKRYAARFMTITCQTRPDWQERIPAVVHVDGTARPQIISRDPNPLYYDIVTAYGAETGIPVLINTSFNAHEEPIINTPQECARALLDDRIDAVVTDRGLYTRTGGGGSGTAG
jgi:carbamoyltransferase